MIHRSGRSPGRSARAPVSMRPTVFGVALALIVGVVAVKVPGAADPSVAGVVWGSLVALLVVGAVWPPLSVAWLHVELRGAPTDIEMGGTGEIALVLTGRSGLIDLRVVGATGVGPWHRASSPAIASAQWTATNRGVVGHLLVEARVSAPLGILTAVRRFRVAVPFPVHSVPAPVPMTWTPTALPLLASGASAPFRGHGSDEVAGVRPYVTGDSARSVHWPSTARAGTLIVREMDPPSRLGAAVVVGLVGDRAGDDATVARAIGLVDSISAAGGEVVLCTADSRGPVVDEVTGIEARRRLAGAIPGPIGVPPAGWPVLRP